MNGRAAAPETSATHESLYTNWMALLSPNHPNLVLLQTAQRRLLVVIIHKGVGRVGSSRLDDDAAATRVPPCKGRHVIHNSTYDKPRIVALVMALHFGH
jgi:hypothetical protein